MSAWTQLVERVLRWLGRRTPATDHLPVALKDANPFGLHDIHGNVLEWCEDAWHENYDGAPTDGAAWGSETAALRFTRGGSWERAAKWARSALRGGFGPRVRSVYLGFRPAKSVAP